MGSSADKPDLEMPDIPPEWLEEFEVRPLETRFRYSFIKTYKPALHDASYGHRPLQN